MLQMRPFDITVLSSNPYCPNTHCRWHSEADAEPSLGASVTAQLADPGLTLSTAKAASDFVARTLTRADELGEPLSVELTGKLASALAERGHWDAVGKLAAGAKLTTLASAPGLAAAAVEAGQYTLLSRLLLQVCKAGAT